MIPADFHRPPALIRHARPTRAAHRGEAYFTIAPVVFPQDTPGVPIPAPVCYFTDGTYSDLFYVKVCQ